MSSSSGRAASVAAGDLQLVTVADRSPASLPPRPPSSSSSALVEYIPPAANPDDENLEIKLCVPIRINNTSSNSAGSGFGDFHQYHQMRRKEQDRLARMDVDYQKRKELAEFNQRREERLKAVEERIAEFNQRREERLKAAEERTAKKRLKRQKIKQKKGKKSNPDACGGKGHPKEQSSSDDGDSDNE